MPDTTTPMRWHCTTCGHEWPHGNVDTHTCGATPEARTRTYNQADIDELNQRLIDRTTGMLSKIADQTQQIRTLQRLNKELHAKLFLATTPKGQRIKFQQPPP